MDREALVELTKQVVTLGRRSAWLQALKLLDTTGSQELRDAYSMLLYYGYYITLHDIILCNIMLYTILCVLNLYFKYVVWYVTLPFAIYDWRYLRRLPQQRGDQQLLQPLLALVPGAPKALGALAPGAPCGAAEQHSKGREAFVGQMPRRDM